MTVQLNVKYQCGCSRWVWGIQAEWDRDVLAGLARKDVRFDRLGGYLGTEYFDYVPCSKCSPK